MLPVRRPSPISCPPTRRHSRQSYPLPSRYLLFRSLYCSSLPGTIPFPAPSHLFRSLYCPSLPGTVLFPVPAPFSPLPPPVTAARYAPAEPRQTKTPLHKQRGFPFGTWPCYLRRKNDGISKSSSLSFSFSAKSSISSNFGTTTGLTGFLALAREMPRILSIKRWRVGSSGSS